MNQLKRLDPKNDVVFKLLLARNPELLKAMLEAVLRTQVDNLEILNPELPGDLTWHKQVALDILVTTESGRRFDVEMQSYDHEGLKQRLLCYWARTYSSQLERGDEYVDLDPVISVIWSVPTLFPEIEELHAMFDLRHQGSGIRYCDHLEIHLLQLAKLEKAGQDRQDDPWEAEVNRWARFLVAQSDEELERLAEESAVMGQAEEALKRLSQDWLAQKAAEDRERSEAMHRRLLSRLDTAERGRETAEREREAAERERETAEREREAAEREREAAEREREAALQEAVRALAVVARDILRARFGELPTAVEERLAAANADELRAIAVRAASAPALEDALGDA